MDFLLFLSGLFTLFFLVVAIGTWLITREKDFLKIYFSSKRMGLRGKGMVEGQSISETQEITMRHSSCNTRVRIGIQKNSNHVYYCWRCEVIFPEGDQGGGGPSSEGDSAPDYPPGQGVPIPEEVVKASEKVIQSFMSSSSVK